MRYKTIFISDTHLGGACNYASLFDFLKKNDADTWYIVGDFIDFWAVKRTRVWPVQAKRIMYQILCKSRQGQKFFILPGNHDSQLRDSKWKKGNIEVVNTAVYESGGKKYLVLHGDVFDSVIGHAEWLARICSVGYDFLVRANIRLNEIRERMGLPFWRFSGAFKKTFKGIASYISDFEDKASELAKTQGMDGIICGHIHTACDKIQNGIRYLNCGDWVESRTALVEENDELHLIYVGDK